MMGYNFRHQYRNLVRRIKFSVLLTVGRKVLQQELINKSEYIVALIFVHRNTADYLYDVLDMRSLIADGSHFAQFFRQGFENLIEKLLMIGIAANISDKCI